jgi:hypothetical protein
MTKNEKWIELADKIRDLFRESLGEFRSKDFFQVAGLMGFHAVEKHKSGTAMKPRGENYLPDIIGTNLQNALDSYDWHTHVPMTQDGAVVSGFWVREKEKELPEGYEMEAEGRFLRRAEGQGLRAEG